MSVKRIYYVKHARQTYARGEVTGTIEVMRKDGTPKLGRGGRPMTRRVISKDKSRPNPLKKCGKCGDTINVGDPYLYWEPYFRSSMQAVRCMKPTCFPRPSERESSLIAGVLSAFESVEDAIAKNDQESASDFKSLRDELSESMDEVIEQYKEAAQPFGDAGPNMEAAENLESQKDEVDGLDFEEPPERDELDSCDDVANIGSHVEPSAGDEADDDTSDWKNVEGCPGCDEIFNEKIDEWRTEQADKFQEVSVG
jgi:ribosomal protein L9